MEYYQDHWIRFIASVFWAHFIKALGYSESLFEMFLEQGYFTDIVFGTLITLLIWESIRQTTILLERRYDWLEHTLARTALQVALGIVAPALLLFFIMLLYFRYAFGMSILDTSWLLIEYRVSVLFMVVVNGYYLGRYFYMRYRRAEAQLMAQSTPGDSPAARPLPETPVPAVQSLIALKGARNIPVPVENIAYCYLQDGHYFLRTFEEEHLMIDHTLDEIESLLPPASFFRLNRQTLAHWKACAAFKSIAGGKLEVTLKPAHTAPVIVSQKKAAILREWLVSR